MDVSINYTIEELSAIIRGKFLSHSSQTDLTHILLDSRKLLYPSETIFFALNQGHRSGSNYINILYEKGVRSFVVDESLDISEYNDCNIILVDDVLQALQLLATHHGSKFKFPVIGITGSNGKTIVKEWLYHLLHTERNIVRSPKSYNSQIGVPLSVLQLQEQHTLALFEAGISQPGEMEKLATIIRPSIGVFTNIGDAHSEGFANKGEKIREKFKLFSSTSFLIIGIDDTEVKKELDNLMQSNPALQLITWSKKQDAFLQIISIKKYSSTIITALFNKQEIKIEISFIDEASIDNAITCWCVMLHMGIAQKAISERMLQLHPVEMRLELRHGLNNCSIINDSYSADINSLKIALNFLHQQKQHKKQTVILSDILQSGKSDHQLYSEVASLLKHKNIRRLIGIGSKISLQHHQFSFIDEKYFYESVDEFKSAFHHFQFRDETILLKGARVFEFEQINALLEKKIHQTVLIISLSAIAHNLKQYQQLLQLGVKTMAVVKAFSYGSGSYEIANLLQFNNIDYLCVAYTDEGVELRKAGITVPILVMNPEENSFSALTNNNLEPELFSFSILNSFNAYLQCQGVQHYPVHIKLDTGMHRLGFEEKDVSELGNNLSNASIKVRSVFSHLSASDDPHQDDFTKKQAAVFFKCSKQLENALGYPFLKHIANTSAISRHPDMQLDMVRLGIGLYGIDNNFSMQKKLKNVSTLTTTIAQVKNVKAGDSIGYGCEVILDKNATIATVRIGYADGYQRSLSNGVGKMLVQNTLVPVIGKVCMDMTMLDVTGVKCNEGDKVIVFGKELPVQQLAKWCNTIPYEIMTGISQRVNRLYLEE